ncbi:sodium channel protein Nach-like [Schistocerca gregaria]|uniref:sodium channel protein Nach-like n=1 Tax=Schistocerca gregaria TaxID=7010 RepID=UPI00211DCC1E|nr:sodium channel protein Nach-like [Schistocerca gregaria]
MTADHQSGGAARGDVKPNGWSAIPWKFLKMLKNYCLNTTIHGLRYFVEKDRHIVERAFWLVCVAVSWVCAVLLVQEAWYAFRYNPINFVVHPAEPGSATPFPSVIICPRDNRPVIEKFTKRYLKTKSKMDIFQFGDALKEVVYFTGRLASYNTVCMKGGDFKPESKCFRNNFTHLVYSLQMKCKDLFDTCHWRGEEIKCCDNFLPLHSDRGICYAINNVNTWKDGRRPSTAIDMTSNGTTKDPRLVVKFKKITTTDWPVQQQQQQHFLISKVILGTADAKVKMGRGGKEGPCQPHTVLLILIETSPALNAPRSALQLFLH